MQVMYIYIGGVGLLYACKQIRLSVCGMAKQGGRLLDVVKPLRLSCCVACMQGRMWEENPEKSYS